MKKNGLHDGYKSRKFWGFLLIIFLLVSFGIWAPLETALGVGGLLVSAFGVYCGVNVGEKMLHKGLLGSLGWRNDKSSNMPDDTAGDEEEI